MSLDSQFQNPKMAIIRLLKSQGCCEFNQISEKKEQRNRKVAGKSDVEKQKKEEDLKLLRYKEQLELKFNNQKSKLSQIPCVLTLAEQIEQLTQVINGLGHQNNQRINLLSRLKQDLRYQQHEGDQQQNQEYTKIVREKSAEQADLIQNQKLQSEYTSLLRALELTNQKNQKLISKLTNL